MQPMKITAVKATCCLIQSANKYLMCIYQQGHEDEFLLYFINVKPLALHDLLCSINKVSTLGGGGGDLVISSSFGSWLLNESQCLSNIHANFLHQPHSKLYVTAF